VISVLLNRFTDITIPFSFLFSALVAMMKGCVISCRQSWSPEVMNCIAGSCMETVSHSHRSEPHRSRLDAEQAIIGEAASLSSTPDYAAERHTWAMYEQEQTSAPTADMISDRPSSCRASQALIVNKITQSPQNPWPCATCVCHFLEVLDVLVR